MQLLDKMSKLREAAYILLLEAWRTINYKKVKSRIELLILETKA